MAAGTVRFVLKTFRDKWCVFDTAEGKIRAWYDFKHQAEAWIISLNKLEEGNRGS